MKRILIKIFCILLVVAYVMCMTNIVFAENGKSGKDIVNLFDGKNTSDVVTDEGENLIVKVIGIVLSVLRIVTTAVALIMLTFLGIKYMSAAPNEKANIKNQLVTFTIGAIVVVGTTSILDIIKNFAEGIKS